LNIYENVGDAKTVGGTVLEYNVDAGVKILEKYISAF
jgi:hypothetical protein